MIVKSDTVQTFIFDGLLIRDFTAELDTSSSLAHICVLPHAHHRRAWSRECDKYYYVTSGQLEFKLDSTEHTLQAGDLCVVPRGHKFSYTNTTEISVELLLMHTPKFNLDAEVFDE